MDIPCPTPTLPALQTPKKNSEKSLEHHPTLCVNRDTTNEQHTMSNTTDTNTSAANLSANHDVELLRTPDGIATRLNHWIQTQQVCWVIIATRSGTCMEVSGKLSHSSIGGRSSYRLNDINFLSNANFLLQAVESVGMTCIFLKP